MLGTNDIEALRGATAYCKDGNKIGAVSDVYVDDQTSRLTWVTVNSGLLGLRTNFVPIEGATLDGDRLNVAYGKDVVTSAPSIDPDGHLSPAEEEELYRYYGTHGYTEKYTDDYAGIGGYGYDPDNPRRDVVDDADMGADLGADRGADVVSDVGLGADRGADRGLDSGADGSAGLVEGADQGAERGLDAGADGGADPAQAVQDQVTGDRLRDAQLPEAGVGDRVVGEGDVVRDRGVVGDPGVVRDRDLDDTLADRDPTVGRGVPGGEFAAPGVDDPVVRDPLAGEQAGVRRTRLRRYGDDRNVFEKIADRFDGDGDPNR